jgi:putative tryptophan/tyrosine transport system substrate-binding protein
MKAKILVYALPILILATIYLAEAQQAKKIPRIGYVSSGYGPGRQLEAFRQGLRELGYVEGKNILIEDRYLEGNWYRSRRLVDELVRLKEVDVILSSADPVINAAKRTGTIPIVMVTTQEPVEAGLIHSLARPGGNITGLTLLTRELSGKRLELLKEVVPKILRVGVLGDATVSPATALEHYSIAARALKIPLQSLEVRGPNPDFEEAFQAAAKRRVNALVTMGMVLFANYEKRIVDLAIKNRLPSMFEGSGWVNVGGLMSYAAYYGDAWRRAAVYVDKILKGVKPADLPVEQPTKFELVINLKTAKQIGLNIPQSVLFRADKVIK